MFFFFANIYVCLKTLFVKQQIAHQPSIYALDTLGVLVPTIFDIETRLALADTILMQIISLVVVVVVRFLYNLYSTRESTHLYTHSKSCMLFMHKVC